MDTNEQDDTIVDVVEETSNEEVVENTEDTSVKTEKPKRTPEEEVAYYEGRAARLRKKHGIEKPEEKPKDSPKVESSKSTQSSKPGELDFGQLAFHNTKKGSVKIEDPEDVEFLKQTMADTGKSQDSILNSKWFGSELKEKQSTRESSSAVPKSKKRAGQPVSSDLNEAMAKYKEDGTLPSDFETRNKLIDKITDKENKAMFDGPSVDFGQKK